MNKQSELIFVPSTQTTDEKKEFFQIELDREEISDSDLKKIGEFFVYDENGNRHQMANLSAEFKTVFVFIRSMLCFTSAEYVEDLAKIPKEILREKQVRLIVIGCAHWKHIKAFRRLTKFPYLMFCDIDYDLYNLLGFYRNNQLGKSGSSIHVKSSNWKGLLNSCKRAIYTSEVFDYQGRFDQQGGCLIIGPGPVFRFFSRDQNAHDHTPINQILKEVNINPIFPLIQIV